MFEPYRRSLSRLRLPALFRALSLLALLAASTAPALAQGEPVKDASRGSTTGLALPRFATTRSTPINVRVGPGAKYDVAWIYVKAGVPVEIVQEFDTWRKIRDVDGSVGWIHQNLLVGTRSGYVEPAAASEDSTLHSSKSDDSSARAMLGKGFRIQIKDCDGTWCEVTAVSQVQGERSASYSGYLHQNEIWGAYPNENFD